jgi:hypothetical protein
MKKSILAVVVALIMAAFAAAPARAVEPIAAGVIAMVVIGPQVLADKVRDGTLPAAPPVCRMEKVQAANGNYFYEVVARDNPSNCR